MGTAGYPRSGGLASVFGEEAKLCSTCQTEVPLTRGFLNVACQFLEMPMSPLSICNFLVEYKMVPCYIQRSDIRNILCHIIYMFLPVVDFKKWPCRGFEFNGQESQQVYLFLDIHIVCKVKEIVLLLLIRCCILHWGDNDLGVQSLM